IVPIHSVHEDEKAGLRAVCMPYFGGASLAAVIKALWSATDLPTRGEQLLRALEQVQAPTLEAVKQQGHAGQPSEILPGRPTAGRAGSSGAADSTPHSLLGGFSDLRAAAWVVARFAEGLQHAHQAG